MNNKPNTTSLGRMVAAVSVSLVLAAGTTNAVAADRTWNGGGDQSSWLDAANWGGTAPVANDSLFFGGEVGLFPNNDFAAETDFAGITFNAGAGAFTLSGNEVDLTAGVTNNSANEQVFNLNLDNNGANRVHNAALGALVYTGVVRNNQIIKEGTNSLTLSGGSGNASVGTTINNGTVILAKTSGQALGASVTINSNGTLRIAGPGTDQIHFNQRINLEQGGVLDVQNFEEFGALSSIGAVGGIILNDEAGITNALRMGGGANQRGIFGGTLQDGDGVLAFELLRGGHILVLNGASTYSGWTTVQNNRTDGNTFGTRLIVNGSHVGGGVYNLQSSTAPTHLAYLGGTGVVSAAAVNVNGGGALSPGGLLTANSGAGVGQETTGVLTINSPVLVTNGVLHLQLNGTTAGADYDQVVIGGSGQLTITNGNLLLALGFTPATGDKFTIVQVQGTDSANTVGEFTSLNGVATDLSQGTTFVDPGTGKNLRISYRAEDGTFDAGAGNGNDIMLEVVAPVGGVDLTWRGNGTDNNWDVTTTANWWNGAGLVTFTNGDFVTFDDTGSNNIPLNLVGDLTPASILFDATKDYILAGSGKLTGTVVITKTNTGTFTLVTDNDTTGSTIVQRGVLQLGTNGTSGSLSGTVTVGAGGVVALNRSDDLTFNTAPFSGTGGFVHNGDGQLTIAANMNGAFTGNTTNSGGLLQFGDGSSASGSIGGTVHVPAGKTVKYNVGNANVSIHNAFSGGGTVDLLHATDGRFETLQSAVSSNFNGTINVVQGILKSFDNNSGYAFGNGSTVNASNFTQVWIDRSATTYNQTFNIAGKRLDDFPGFPGEPVLRMFGCTLDGEINLLADSRIGGTISSATILAPIHGSFELDVFGNADYVLNMGPTTPHTYASTVVRRGWLRALNTNAISSGPLTLDVAGGLRLNGNNLSVASLTSTDSGLVTGSGAQVQNSHGSTAATLTVGSDNSSTQFDGVFSNGGGGALGLTKTGSGTFTVTGVNTSTGAVTVNGGTLALSGSGSFGNASQLIANATLDVTGTGGTLTLSSGQTLGGNGNVNGIVMAPAGSTVSPGTSVGTLTVSGDISLSGLLFMELNRTNAQTADSLVSSGGTITYGGSLLITNIGPALQVNDTFQVFPSGVSGFGANITIATTDANGLTYTWQNDIATLGSVKVLSVAAPVNPNPTNIVSSVSGGNLNLSWPEDHTGWSLQTQTNGLGVGLSNNWTTLGYENTNAVSFPIDPANPAVFYRLFYVAP